MHPLTPRATTEMCCQKTGTSGPEPFRVVLLQRLANPLADFDETPRDQSVPDDRPDADQRHRV